MRRAFTRSRKEEIMLSVYVLYDYYIHYDDYLYDYTIVVLFDILSFYIAD